MREKIAKELWNIYSEGEGDYEMCFVRSGEEQKLLDKGWELFVVSPRESKTQHQSTDYIYLRRIGGDFYEQADDIIKLICSEIEKMENPYQDAAKHILFSGYHYQRTDGFEDCRQAMLTLLKK